VAREAFELAAAKLPIRTKFVMRPAFMAVREEVIYDAPMSDENLDGEANDAAVEAS
jgi:hypothetical protein